MVQSRKRRQESDDDMDWCPQQAPATRSRSFSNGNDENHCQDVADGSSLQRLQCHVNICESPGANGGITPLSNQPAEQTDGIAANCVAGSKSIRRTKLYNYVQSVIRNKSIAHPDKITMIHADLRDLLEVEDREAEVAMDDISRNLDHEAQAEIAKWKNEYRAMREARSRVQEALSELQGSIFKVRAENEDLQKHHEEMRADNENLRSKPVCQDPNLNAAVEDFGNLGDRGLHRTVQQLKQSEILAQILTLASEAQKRLQEHESPMVIETPGSENGDKRQISQELEEREAAHGVAQLDAVPGSYTDHFATPNMLDAAFSTSKAAVTNLQKAFFDMKEFAKDDLWETPPLDNFARPKHTAYWAKSFLSFTFFDGFENESFGTSAGVPKYLDPDIRQTKFYEDYRNGDADNDPQFKEFCEMKVSAFRGKIGLVSKEAALSCLEESWGPELCSCFTAAARSVWLLHKLAFSFEPPAAIFSVDSEAPFDPNYMKSLGSTDDERFVAKVGFMISPGLRLRKLVMPCEVYLRAAGPIVPQSPI